MISKFQFYQGAGMNKDPQFIGVDMWIDRSSPIFRLAANKLRSIGEVDRADRFTAAIDTIFSFLDGDNSDQIKQVDGFADIFKMAEQEDGELFKRATRIHKLQFTIRTEIDQRLMKAIFEYKNCVYDLIHHRQLIPSNLLIFDVHFEFKEIRAIKGKSSITLRFGRNGSSDYNIGGGMLMFENMLPADVSNEDPQQFDIPVGMILKDLYEIKYKENDTKDYDEKVRLNGETKSIENDNVLQSDASIPVQSSSLGNVRPIGLRIENLGIPPVLFAVNLGSFLFGFVGSIINSSPLAPGTKISTQINDAPVIDDSAFIDRSIPRPMYIDRSITAGFVNPEVANINANIVVAAQIIATSPIGSNIVIDDGVNPVVQVNDLSSVGVGQVEQVITSFLGLAVGGGQEDPDPLGLSFIDFIINEQRSLGLGSIDFDEIKEKFIRTVPPSILVDSEIEKITTLGQVASLLKNTGEDGSQRVKDLGKIIFETDNNKSIHDLIFAHL